jgi:hypothetical protein
VEIKKFLEKSKNKLKFENETYIITMISQNILTIRRCL